MPGYFDNEVIRPPARAKTLIKAKGWSSSFFMNVVKAAVALKAPMSYWNFSQSTSWLASGSANLITNGDFFDKNTNAINFANGATITILSGPSYTGNYIRIQQPKLTANSVYFDVIAIPFAGSYTAGFWIRSHSGAGSQDIRISLNAIHNGGLIDESGWQWLNLTQDDLTENTIYLPSIHTSNGLGYDVDVCYAGLHPGAQGPLIQPRHPSLNVLDYQTHLPTLAFESPGTSSFNFTGGVQWFEWAYDSIRSELRFDGRTKATYHAGGASGALDIVLPSEVPFTWATRGPLGYYSLNHARIENISLGTADEFKLAALNGTKKIQILRNSSAGISTAVTPTQITDTAVINIEFGGAIRAVPD